MSRAFAIPFLLALSLGIYLGTTSAPALVDEADCAHAIAARELRESADWAVLHINGIRYLEKAPLHYWLVAASYKLLGESDFSTRLPLALATVALVLMVYVFGRRFFGERAGFYAGLVMCTSLGTFVFTRTMIPEAIYALEFTAAFYLFLRAWQGTLAARIGYWGAAALVALATLTRGLVGVIFPVAVIGLFLLAIGGWRRWRDLPLLSSALLFLAIALPWHLITARRVPGFWSFYIFNEHILRAIGARYPQDSATVPLALWWALHLAWFFPWSFFLPHALAQFPLPSTWRAAPNGAAGLAEVPAREARLLLFAWAGFILFFFSLTRRMEYYSFGAAWLLRRRGRALSAALAMALGAAGFIFAANGAYRIFEPHLSSRALAEEISKHLRAEDRILLYGDFYNACTVSFYTHRKTWIWNGRYHSLEYGSYFPDAPRIFLTDQDFAAFWEVRTELE